jgi:glycyl-tRNA synthetase alpha chain
VVLKPPPADIQEIYLQSLEAIGIRLREHDIKFEEDNWEWPVGGAWGVGWQVMLDGLEITQFTYFQQCGGMDLDPISGEITYGLERIAAFLQDVDSLYDVVWALDPRTGKKVTYGDIRLEEELQLSVYNFEAADVGKLWEHLRLYEAECQALLDAFHQQFKVEKAAERKEKIHDRLVHDGAAPADEDMRVALRRFPVLGAYELCLKCSHLFNLLDARGAISVTERVAVMARIRNMVVGVAKAYAMQRQRAGAR